MTFVKEDLPAHTEESLQKLLKQCRNERETRKVQVVLLWVKNGWTREQIAQATGYAKATVRDIQLSFFKRGEEALIRRSIPAEKNQYLKRSNEAEFLRSFHQSALEGELVSTRDIREAFEAQVGKKVAHSTIYRLLHRHGWRKITPRPKHPKADAQERERFKKTSEIVEKTQTRSQTRWAPVAFDVSG